MSSTRNCGRWMPKSEPLSMAGPKSAEELIRDGVVSWISLQEKMLRKRIECVVGSADVLECCRQYELPPCSQSLFEDIGLRAGKKLDIITVIDNICKISNKLP
ncbi:hypothetical protein AVEN_37279-1 [Araneus ventricosus]|uniref:Uncharacterized protein n=1 Tax=Araneus ventricosus TaxID=182803 RepID=A0A4Y2MH40_ARAVE|nr:hypothetical protein AVEN_37279-1 [Araneus ventricosus]